jgi:hypothetical protein
MGRNYILLYHHLVKIDIFVTSLSEYDFTQCYVSLFCKVEIDFQQKNENPCIYIGAQQVKFIRVLCSCGLLHEVEGAG